MIRLRKKKSVIPRGLDYPTIIIAFSWIGLLALWPRSPYYHEQSDQKIASNTVVILPQCSLKSRLYTRPDLIAFPSSVSFAPKCQAGGIINPALEIEYGKPLYLKRNSLFLFENPAEHLSLSTAVADSEMEYSVTRPKQSLLFTSNKLSRIDIQISNQLTDYDFVIGDLSGLIHKSAKVPWQTDLTVMLATNGKVEHVFMDVPTENTNLNIQIISVLRKAKAIPPNEPINGRVKISHCL